MTTLELVNALPPRLSYFGIYYDLGWRVDSGDSRILEVCYTDDLGNVLITDACSFHICSECHYATLSMLRLIYNQADTLLSYIWMQDPNFYNQLLDALYQNIIRLLEICNSFQWEETAMNVFDNRVISQSY